jgi:twitching motility protein PilT
VFSTLHTTDASKTIERIIGVFEMGKQNAMRNRLAKSFRYIISQRLLPRKDGAGRVAVIEILKSTLRTREYVEKGESEGKSLLDAMRDGSEDGMQCFDDEIEKNIRSGVLDLETGISYSTNAGNLRLQLADMLEEQSNIPSAGPALRMPTKPGTKAAEPAVDPGMEIIR